MKVGSYSRREDYAKTYYWHLPAMASPVCSYVCREVTPDGRKGAAAAGAVSGEAAGCPLGARLISDPNGEALGRGENDRTGPNLGI